MDHTYWSRQTVAAPLFPDLLWARPEQNHHAGKLALIGGNSHSFASVARAYQQAELAGIGSLRVLLPSSLQKTIGHIFAASEYAPSTKSGGFSQSAIAELLEISLWADGSLFAGDLGHNSETSLLLENYFRKSEGQLTLVDTMSEFIIENPMLILKRPKTLLVLQYSSLQKIAKSAKRPEALLSTDSLLTSVERLQAFSEAYGNLLLIMRGDHILAAYDGKVISQEIHGLTNNIDLAAKASVWWLQNENKPLESIATSLV